MKLRKDLFGQPLANYDTFVNNLLNQVNTNMVAWNIPAPIVAVILALLTTWNLKWAASKNKTAATSGDRTATRNARKALTAYLRPFIQTFIMRNANITDANII